MLTVAGFLAFYLAWNLGANDVANSMGTSVGSKAITLQQALIIAAVMEFSGALIFGQGVSQKLATGILDLNLYTESPDRFVLGMMAVLLSAGIWMNVATVWGLPVSSSHATVGAIAGFGAVSLGVNAVRWESLGVISLAWVVTPLVTATIAAILYQLVLTLKLDDDAIFAKLQVMSACGVAFAHGSNDVGNAIAPFAAIVSVLNTYRVPIDGVPIPVWVLALGGVGIVCGLAVWGKRVIETVGEGIIELQPKGGFCAELATAMAVLAASNFGLPVSTSHALVGAVIGIGLVKGRESVQWEKFRSIALTWLATIPASIGLSMGVYKILQWIL